MREQRATAVALKKVRNERCNPPDLKATLSAPQKSKLKFGNRQPENMDFRAAGALALSHIGKGIFSMAPQIVLYDPLARVHLQQLDSYPRAIPGQAFLFIKDKIGPVDIELIFCSIDDVFTAIVNGSKDHDFCRGPVTEAERLHTELTEAVGKDVAALEAVQAAIEGAVYQLPKFTEDEEHESFVAWLSEHAPSNNVEVFGQLGPWLVISDLNEAFAYRLRWT